MSASSIDVLNLTTDELRKKFSADKIEPYRADQVHQWIFEKGIYDFDRMTNLSGPLREQLKKSFSVDIPRDAEKQMSPDDKSIKLLIKLKKGDFV